MDPLQLEVDATKRLGVDHWFRLSMNDWHHWGTDNTELNLQSSSFYDNHPEYLIGEEGARGWNDNLAKVLQYFQDWMHDEVRALRRDRTPRSTRNVGASGVADTTGWILVTEWY